MTPPPSRTVLYVSALPPPGGGVATWTRILFDRGLGEGWTARLVDTRLSRSRRTLVAGRASLAEAGRNARILLSLARELVAHRPDLVHFNVGSFDLGLARDTLGAALARAFGVPSVFHYHGDLARPALGGAAPPRAALARALRVARLHVVMNRSSLEFLESLPGARGRPVALLPNFFDETRMPARSSAEGPDRPKRVLFVAALNVAKGTTLVLDVARSLPDVEFHLVGRVYDEVRAELLRAPSNVVVHAELGHEAVLDRMARSDLLLFPTRHPEGFPYAVLEAMAMGMAVVATPVGAIPEMVGEGGGSLCPAETGALVEAVREWLGDDARRAAAGRANRERSHRLYAYSAVRPRLLDLYESLLRGGPGS